MVKLEIVKSLVLDIKKKFNKVEANRIIDLIQSLKENPKRGKLLSSVGGILIKELKYKNFRFYFITDGFKFKFLDEEELVEILLRFVRMLDKKNQQQTINEIKRTLKIIGPTGFK